MSCPHAAPEAAEATAPEATEAATAASRRIAGTHTHGYEGTREAAVGSRGKRAKVHVIREELVAVMTGSFRPAPWTLPSPPRQAEYAVN
jgi:aspartate/methionine/tyrosine aminotransferase